MNSGNFKMNNIESIINQTGYWRVVIKPNEHVEQITSFTECKDIMENITVSFRGWNFPHVDINMIDNMSNWIEMSTNIPHLPQYKEYWKFFLSGQFAFKGALVEDYLIDDIERNSSLAYYRGDEELPHKYLSILSSLYKITEIFEFASRLIDRQIIKNRFTISISLVDTLNRMLFFWDRARDLRKSYICKIERIKFEKEFVVNDFSSNKIDYANSCVQDIFERFGWDRYPGNIFKEEQLKLVEKRL